MKKLLAIAGAVLTLTASGLVSAGSASASTTSPVSIDFSNDTAGAHADGFTSSDSPQVFFYSTPGSGVVVADLAAQSHGKAIYPSGAPNDALEIRLAHPSTAISLAFGNDDPALSNASDLARLTLYRGATLVDQIDVNVNANDIMDQRIGRGRGTLFNRATFQYVDAAGAPLGLYEVVDDIELNPLCTVAGNAGNNVLVGTSGADVICGDAGNDVIRARGGNDLVYAGTGNDTVRGGSGKDTILGASGRDHLYGGRGADKLLGLAGRDFLDGGKGLDTCLGGSGHDTGHSCELKASIP